jgi:hypothetical protein
MHAGYPLFFFVTSRIALARPVLIALMLATSSAAAPFFEAEVDADAQSAGGFDNIGDFVSDSAPVSLDAIVAIDSAVGFASVASGPGSLAVLASSTYVVIDPNSETHSSGAAIAISTIDDLVFTGTGPLDGIFLVLELSGMMAVTGVTESAASSIELGFKLNNLPSPSGIGGFRTVQLPTFFADSGVLDGVWAQGQADFSGTITVGPFDNVPTGIPLELRMSMSLATFAFKFPKSEIGDSANALGDLGSTLNFRSSGSVFTGPFESVSSVQGSIVDGMWMGTPVTVPEPSAPSLAALCALAAIYTKRRHQHARLVGETRRSPASSRPDESRRRNDSGSGAQLGCLQLV